MADDIKQFSLFGDRPTPNSCEEEWVGMPEYYNIDEPPPMITATFKFRNEEDFETFKEAVKKYLYNGERVFDGAQGKTVKSAWFPLAEKESRYRYR